MIKDSDHLSKYFPSNILKVSIRHDFPVKILCYTVIVFFAANMYVDLHAMYIIVIISNYHMLRNLMPLANSY